MSLASNRLHLLPPSWAFGLPEWPNRKAFSHAHPLLHCFFLIVETSTLDQCVPCPSRSSHALVTLGSRQWVPPCLHLSLALLLGRGNLFNCWWVTQFVRFCQALLVWLYSFNCLLKLFLFCFIVKIVWEKSVRLNGWIYYILVHLWLMVLCSSNRMWLWVLVLIICFYFSCGLFYWYWLINVAGNWDLRSHCRLLSCWIISGFQSAELNQTDIYKFSLIWLSCNISSVYFF